MVTGDAVPVARDVAYVPLTRGAQRFFYGYDVAADGTLVHVYSPGASSDTWVVALSDRAGTVTPLPLPAAAYDTLRVSPDGSRIAVTTRPTIAFGNPVEVPRRFRGTADGSSITPRAFDIMPNGRFIGLHVPRQSAGAAGTVPAQPEIHIILNWFEELKRLVPVK